MGIFTSGKFPKFRATRPPADVRVVLQLGSMQHALLKGMGTSIDLLGVAKPPTNVRIYGGGEDWSPKRADRHALQRDWEEVGRDLDEAIERFEKTELSSAARVHKTPRKHAIVRDGVGARG